MRHTSAVSILSSYQVASIYRSHTLEGTVHYDIVGSGAEFYPCQHKETKSPYASHLGSFPS